MTALAPGRPDAQAELADLIRIRRDLHQHPELRFEERRTAALAAATLRALGYDVTEGLGITGVAGVLSGGKPGRTLLLRADMDALPITEAGDAPYKSRTPGVMHACGHDGHVAIGLATARRLAAARAELAGTVKYVFQPGEEGGCGAQKMIDDGVLASPRVDAAFGIHLWNDLPTGTIAVTPGAMMAAVDEFHVTITGKGGHAAVPQQAVDPIVCAAQVVTALQTLASRGTDPFGQLVVSVTQIHAGANFNVIPETATLHGTVRTMNEALWNEMPRRFTALVEGIAAGLGCTAAVDYQRQSPTLVNHPDMVALVTEAAEAVAGKANVLDHVRTMGGEDFAFFGRHVPSCFAFVGSRNPAKGADASHHSPRFDIDEDALLVGVELADTVARAFLR
jgi:amidohydrolase